MQNTYSRARYSGLFTNSFQSALTDPLPATLIPHCEPVTCYTQLLLFPVLWHTSHKHADRTQQTPGGVSFQSFSNAAFAYTVPGYGAPCTPPSLKAGLRCHGYCEVVPQAAGCPSILPQNSVLTANTLSLLYYNVNLFNLKVWSLDHQHHLGPC